jgi:hypothetical protein
LVYNTYDASGALTEIRTVTVTNQTKVIDGVTCIIVTDVVKDATTGAFIENTQDYFAQDKSGNVWYFGEDAQNYKNGKFVNTDGSWLAGQLLPDGSVAAPGIVMEAKPKVGDTYQQENAPGVAQDYAMVLNLGAKIGGWTGLLQTNDVNPLDVSKTGLPTEQEYKYYAAGIGEVYSTTSVLNNKGQYVLAETEQLYSINGQLVQAMASFGASPSASQSPLSAAFSDQQTLHNVLAANGHHT